MCTWTSLKKITTIYEGQFTKRTGGLWSDLCCRCPPERGSRPTRTRGRSHHSPRVSHEGLNKLWCRGQFEAIFQNTSPTPLLTVVSCAKKPIICKPRPRTHPRPAPKRHTQHRRDRAAKQRADAGSRAPSRPPRRLGLERPANSRPAATCSSSSSGRKALGECGADASVQPQPVPSRRFPPAPEPGQRSPAGKALPK